MRGKILKSVGRTELRERKSIFIYKNDTASERVSFVLNNNDIWTQIAKVLGHKLDDNSEIYSEVEHFIVSKMEEMQEESFNKTYPDDFDYSKGYSW